MKKDLPDKELIELANKGDESAINTLYLRHREWVYGLAYRFCGNREDAQEDSAGKYLSISSINSPDLNCEAA